VSVVSAEKFALGRSCCRRSGAGSWEPLRRERLDGRRDRAGEGLEVLVPLTLRHVLAPLPERGLNPGENGEHIVLPLAWKRHVPPALAIDFLGDVHHQRSDLSKNLLVGIQGLEVVLRGGLRALDLQVEVAELLPAPQLGVLLRLPLVLDVAIQLFVPFLERLNLPIQLVHVREQAEIPLLELHEYLHDLFDVGDPRRGLDRRKSLFEDLNVLLVLLDVAALNRVQEGKLQDPLHHRRLAEIQLLIRDKILPSILVALVRVSLHLHLGLFLLPVLLLGLDLEPLHLFAKALPAALALLRERRDADFDVLDHILGLVLLGLDLEDAFGAPADVLD